MELEFPSEFSGKELTVEKIGLFFERYMIKYKLGNIISKGGFSICYKCCCIKNNKLEIYVAKEIIDFSLKRVRNEIFINKYLDNKNIVKLIDNFLYDNKHYLIFEYCSNGDLYSLLKKRTRLTEIEVQYYIQHLIQALIHLRDNNIIHRDIKLKNMYLTENMEFKLGDFGLAKKLFYFEEKCIDVVGTLHYMAPEIFEEKSYSFPADIWSIGVIMYALIIGKLPFNGENFYELKEKIIRVDYNFPENAIISNSAKDLIKLILIRDPEKRPNIYRILEHDFFNLGNSIPKKLPKYFIDRPPSLNYIRNFMKDADENGIVNREVTTKNLNYFEIFEKDEENNKNDNNKKLEIYVVECIPIKKYGLGYQLSDNSYGVCFNDCTKILKKQNSNIFYYIEKKENLKDYKLFDTELPIDVQKKYEILQDFINIFVSKENASSNILSQNDVKEYYEKYYKEISLIQKIKVKKDYNEISLNHKIYVKKYYLCDNNTIVLRLNNDVIQIYFFDGEIILFSKNQGAVTFIKKDRDRVEK